MKTLSQIPLVVSGLGFITSIGNSRQEVFDNLKSLRHGFEQITILDNPEFPVKLAGTIKGFATDSPYYQKWRYPSGYVIPKALLRALPPHGVYAYCAIEQAISDAGLTVDELKNDRTALYCSSAGSPYMLQHYASEMQRNKGMRGSPFGVVSTISGTLNFNLGSHYGVKGGNCGFVSACSSSAHAIGFAMDQINLGRVDRVIIVGAEELNDANILPFSAMRVLSTDSDPTSASCPFDKKRNGFVSSGGAVAIVIEREDIAKQREDIAPYGELKGWYQTSDGFNPAIAEPSGQALKNCMNKALEDAETSPSEVDYVNAHATSTIQGDIAESKAIASIFEESGNEPYVSSTKALTGHPLSMAGAMEVGFCLLALKEGFIPGQAHLQTPDESVADLNFPLESLSKQPSTILKNSCGFGGSNVSLVLKRWAK